MMCNYKDGYIVANFQNFMEVCRLFKVSKHIFYIFFTLLNLEIYRHSFFGVRIYNKL
jgi:hypothetical protein